MVNIKPSHYIMGIIAFTLFIMAGMSMMGEFRAADDTFANDERYTQFNQTFNVYSNVTTEVGQLQEGITNADTDFGAFGVLNSLIATSWQTLRLTISSFGFMNSVFLGSHTVFGVPVWVAGLVILAVSVIFVFAIFSAIFQRDL